MQNLDSYSSMKVQAGTLKVAAPLFKPEVRLHANRPRSERMSQLDERKTYVGTRLCVFTNLMSV